MSVARALPGALAVAALLCGCTPVVTANPDPEPASVQPASRQIERPNLLVIVADDLGYTDLGAFGGEIRTPNLDALARRGVRLTNFHSNASCAPTRAMLLTGTDNHLAGMGSQSGLATPEQAKHPQYANKLAPDVKTVATRLRAAGYRTYASAKWHLGGDAPQLPGKRGFDRSLVLLEGGGGHFDATPLLPHYGRANWLLDDAPHELPADFYSSRYMTDVLMEFIATDSRADAPFFAWLGYTAPHWPLQAPAEDLERYRGAYESGYEALLDERMIGARREAVVAPDARGVTRNVGVVPWAELGRAEQRAYAARMSAYAAMVDNMDQQVGRLLAFLADRGELDNTFIFFMSDNGAEGHPMEFLDRFRPWVEENFDNGLANIGNRTSYTTLGAGFARATAAPFRDSKSKVAEGGIRVPAFAVLPAALDSTARIDGAFTRVSDVTPTLLELAGVAGDAAIRGRSLLARLQGDPAPVYAADEPVCWEVYGRRAVHLGRWKALLQDPPFGTGEWQLYDLARDPGEQNDLAAEHPRQLAAMQAHWQRYANEVGVVLPETPIYY